MNKTFNINLGGYPFAIDEDAFNYIQQYLDAIRKHFSASDGCDEILYDIEVRMAELFQEHGQLRPGGGAVLHPVRQHHDGRHHRGFRHHCQ